MACISDNELVELLEGALEPIHRARVLEELATCETCRELFQQCLVRSSGRPAHDALPDELAGYRLGRVLGAGGGGIVVRAFDPTLDREIALKLVRTDGNSAARALHEARTLATVRHPAVVQVHATGAVDRLGYVAMELVDGDSLAQRIARGPIPWRRAASWFADVADGLAAIHATGVVHRDVKPGNLLVDGDRLRIADFGLATRDPDNAFAGTLPYLAPEVLAGTPADARSDVYALFVSLFEAITGDRPYREHERRALRAAAEHGHPLWPARVPRRVRRIVERGLAGDPARRYRDALAARDALRELGARRATATTIVAAACVLGIAMIGLAASGALSTKGATCAVRAPSWQPIAPRFSPPVRARLASYGERMVTAQTLACASSAPTAISQRSCLARLDDRVFALLVTTAAEREVSRALYDLPTPASCATSHEVAVASAELQTLGVAQAMVARREPKQALAELAAVPSGSALAADADVVRGRANLDLGDDAAAANAFRSVAERAANTGRDDLAVAANNGLALAIGVHQHESAAGEAYAMAARAAALKLEDRREAAIARRTIGLLASQAGDVPRAMHELVAAIDELAPLDAPLELADSELALARITMSRGDYTAARQHVERAGVLRLAALGKDHPDTIAIDAELANIDAVDGHPDRAAAAFRAVIARIEALYGRDEPALASPLQRLGRALVSLGDFPGADQALSRVLALDRARRGELDRATGSDYANLAGVRVVEGKRNEAVALYRAAIASVRSVTGDDHLELAPIYYGLAVALEGPGQFAAASEAIGHAIDIWRAHPGHDQDLGRALAARALTELSLEHVANARRDAEDALAVLTRLHGPDHIALAPALLALAQAELAAGEVAPAQTTAERLLAIHQAVAGAKPRNLVEGHFLLGQILWRRNHHAEALAQVRHALAEIGTSDPPTRARIAAWLASPS